MGAGFGWVDFSDRDRQAVGTVLDLFKTQGVVDELGIGTVRDAIADKLFPGINTIQTRAKYFLLPLVIVREYYKEKPRKKLEQYFRKLEDEIIEKIAAKYRDEWGETRRRESGIMGILLDNAANLARKPSSIYWNGIRLHRLIRTHYSLTDYLRSNSRDFYEVSLSGQEIANDKDAGYQDETNIDLPAGIGIDSFDRIELTRQEAEYLEMKFQSVNEEKDTDNLLTCVYRNSKTKVVFLDRQNFREFYEAQKKIDLPKRTKEHLALAMNFSEMMFGTHLRYNIILRRLYEQPGHADELETEWEEWLKDGIVAARGIALDKLFEIAANTHPVTKRFISDWHESLVASRVDVKKCDKLVVEQEKWNKIARARLVRRGKGQLADNDYGIGRLEYRFPQAWRIVKDIDEGARRRA
jgi:hypothetical protein